MSKVFRIQISVPDQYLETLNDNDELIKRYSVSTAKNGTGQENGSYCTPTGEHIVRAKIGQNEPINTIFRGRRPIETRYMSGMSAENPGQDWILTRILWLSGCEKGHNRGGHVDTMRRYIYIHGTPDETQLGQPGSHGCIRMNNKEIIELFDLTEVGTPVTIYD